MTNTKRPDTARGIDHNRLPTGTVLSDPIKGDFSALPLFGYVSKRDKTNTPLVMLTFLLLRDDGQGQNNFRPKGSLSIEFPVYPETEDAIVYMLDRLGWDGRVWPNDDGWPTGDPDHEATLISLMESARLRATMTFPPTETGAVSMPVSVQRARGPFLMPPLADPDGPVDAVKKEKLRALCENHKVFHRPQKPLIYAP